MKLARVLVILLAGSRLASAQDDLPDMHQIVQAARLWAEENLDTNALQVLDNVDQQKVEQFLQQLQQRFADDYVLDLAALKETAQAILPLLEAHEETKPYAIWLKARLDYLEVADDLRRTAPREKVVPGQPVVPLPNPTPEKEREIWTKRVPTPWPAHSRIYVDRLKPLFAAEQVPPELVWVAEVESSFDARARSPSGASGLFQLMPATARQYGLSTFPFDQRKQPEPSARAAAQYLKYLHNHYHDWRLALAAYNAGQGTVDNLLARRKTTTFDSIATRLPAQTQLFVPKVEATLQNRENVKLADLRPGNE